MAPSASMLFLSYHQLHRPAKAEAPPRKEETAAGGLRLGVSSVFSLGVFERRRGEAEAGRVREQKQDAAGEEAKSSAAADANSKELESRFEEALRLSCWSS